MSQRQLKFETLDQVNDETQRLLNSGYTAVGHWNLAQVCGHLSDWMRFPMDGFPTPGLPIRVVLWLMKVTVGRRQLKKVLADGFSAGLPTMPDTVKSPDAETDEQAVQKLADVIDRIQSHNGAFHPSPLYGHMTREDLVRLQLAHCAHHLSFLQPNDESPES